MSEANVEKKAENVNEERKEDSPPPAEANADQQPDEKAPAVEPSENVYFWGVPANYTDFEMNLLVFAAGDVVSVKMGPPNGKPHTYALVQFTSQEEAEKAINLLNGRKFNSRNLVVRFAKPIKSGNSPAPIKRGINVNAAISDRKKVRRAPEAGTQQGTYQETTGYIPTQPYTMGQPAYATNVQMGVLPPGAQVYGIDPTAAYGQYTTATYAPALAYGRASGSKYGNGAGAGGVNPVAPNSGTGSYSRNNIYVSGLPENVNDKSLEQIFRSYGNVVSTKVIINRNTGAPLGTALVRMETGQQASMAIENLNGCQLGSGHIIQCRFANEKRSSQSSTTNLYVTGLPEDVTEESLKKLFGSHGNVVSQKIIINRNTGQPLGTALVRMETNDQANKCISNLNGAQLPGGKFLSVRFATDKGSHKA